MTVRGPGSIVNGSFHIDVGNFAGSSGVGRITDGASVIGPTNPVNAVRVFRDQGTVELSNGSLTATRAQLLAGAMVEVDCKATARSSATSKTMESCQALHQVGWRFRTIRNPTGLLEMDIADTSDLRSMSCRSVDRPS